MLTKIQKDELAVRLSADRIEYNRPLDTLTSFRIGGPADVLVKAESEEDIETVIDFCQTQQLPWFVLGRGTNLVVRDKGIRGVVLQLAGGLVQVTVTKTTVTAAAGALLSATAAQAAQAGLTGMEFAQGIPGTVGGAVMMNAGAYGGEMKDIVQKVHIIQSDGTRVMRTKEEMGFGYRICALKGSNCIITRVELELAVGDPEMIRARTDDLYKRRWDRQPLNMPSAGSVFRRPEGHYAGALIEEAGLKGFRMGGAQVSEKHAGFIVNTGGATAQDVIDLIQHIQNRVQEQSGVELETEVKIVGEE